MTVSTEDQDQLDALSGARETFVWFLKDFHSPETAQLASLIEAAIAEMDRLISVQSKEC